VFTSAKKGTGNEKIIGLGRWKVMAKHVKANFLYFPIKLVPLDVHCV
jgi:hypothetical protein